VRWWVAGVPVVSGNRGVDPRGWGLSLLEASESGAPRSCEGERENDMFKQRGWGRDVETESR